MGVREDSVAPLAAVMAQMGATAAGLGVAEAARRLERFGPNRVAAERQIGWLGELVGRARNPLNGLLLGLAGLSWFTGDARAGVVSVLMVMVSVVLAFVQEHRSNKAAAALRAMVKTRATVRRVGADGVSALLEVPVDVLVRVIDGVMSDDERR